MEKCSQNIGIAGSSVVLWDAPSEVTGSAPDQRAPSLMTSYLELWQVGNSLSFTCLPYLIDEYNEPDYQKKTDIFNQELYLLAIYSLLLNTHLYTHVKQSPNILMFSCYL